MNNTPFFTIICPCYNASLFIEKTIESVMNQDFVDFELLLINDGSTDSTIDIIKKYENERILVFDKQNTGSFLTREYGVNYARGTYVIFLDSDDVLLSGALSTIKTLIDQNDFPDVVRYIDIVFEKDEPSPIITGKIENIQGNDLVIKKLFVDVMSRSLCGKAVKTSLLKSTLSYDYQFGSIGEDFYRSYIYCKKAKSLVFTDYKIYGYRQQKCSVMHNISPDMYKKYIGILKYIYSDIINTYFIQLSEHNYDSINSSIVTYLSLIANNKHEFYKEANLLLNDPFYKNIIKFYSAGYNVPKYYVAQNKRFVSHKLKAFRFNAILLSFLKKIKHLFKR